MNQFMDASFSFVNNVEDCIWGRYDWDTYARKLVTAESIDETALLEKIDAVKENIGMQIRKGVEQHYPHLVEQAAALHDLGLIQASINCEILHLKEITETLSRRYSEAYENLKRGSEALERLYAVRRLLVSSVRCEQLIHRLETVKDVVKRSEMINELETTVAETPGLTEIAWMTEPLLVTLPKYSQETKNSIISQLKSSLATLNGQLVSSCVRALQNLSCYDSEINDLMNAHIKSLDGDLLKLGIGSDPGGKFLSLLSNRVQTMIQQYTLLGSEALSEFCSRFGQNITNRVPENSSIADKIVQQLSKVVSPLPSDVAQPINKALRPLKAAIISQSLNRMFLRIEEVFSDPEKFGIAADSIRILIHEEESRVEWDKSLQSEMEINVSKGMDLVAQKIEARLSLDEESLRMGERISSAQLINYNLINVAQALGSEFGKKSSSLLAVASQARNAIMSVASRTATTILLSMHKERIGGSPSPYIKELCSFLTVFYSHIMAFSPYSTKDNVLVNFFNCLVEQFLLLSSLVRPVNSDISRSLAFDFRHFVTSGLVQFGLELSAVKHIDLFTEAFTCNSEELPILSGDIPFWFIIQLLISRSQSSLLSPHVSAGWTIEDYLSWFKDQSDKDRLNFFASHMQSYTASVFSKNVREYVGEYPSIMKVLSNTATKL